MFNQKILCLGSESPNTNYIVDMLASQACAINHGLIKNVAVMPEISGYYHTSVADLSPGQIIKLSKQFDHILMLDQPKESYGHYKLLMTTVRLMQDLEKLGLSVEYQNNKSAANLIFWRDYLEKNKSFCFHAFLALVNDIGSTVLCPKELSPLVKIENITNWRTTPEYLEIRNKMAAGELIPERCSDCYDREAEGQESTRQYETLEWAEKLDLKSVDDFFAVENPVFYEIRPSNKCNIMCRTCDDGHSHLIEKEWKKHKSIPLVDWKFINTPVEYINFESAKRIYYGGGEPTIMPEFYEFLRTAIKLGHTDFELSVGTNGMRFSNTLLDLLDNFTNANFAVSFDGYTAINDYIRWGSKFDTVVKNSRILLARGHKVSLQTVISMWNLTRLHEIFEFYDQEFPKSGLLVQVGGGREDVFMPYNHPFPDLVLESLRKCQQTNSYYMNGRSIKSQIDLLVDYYSNPQYNCNIDKLHKFFKFNDELDLYRNTKLGDYIPELEAARKLLND
jgi:pyruvate-formate lyase-activating enzyme